MSEPQTKRQRLCANIEEIVQGSKNVVSSTAQASEDAKHVEKFASQLRLNYDAVHEEYDSARTAFQQQLALTAEQKKQVDEEAEAVKNELKEKTQQLNEKTTELTDLVTQHQTELSSKGEELAALSSQVDDLNNQISALQPKYETLQVEKSQAEKALEQANQNLADLQAQNQEELEQRLAAAQTEADKNRASFKEIQIQKAESMKLMGNFQKTVSLFYANVQEIAEQIESNYDQALETYKPAEAPVQSSGEKLEDSVSQAGSRLSANSSGFGSTYTDEDYVQGRFSKRGALPQNYKTEFQDAENSQRLALLLNCLHQKGMNPFDDQNSANAFATEFWTVKKSKGRSTLRGSPLRVISKFLETFYSVTVDPKATEDYGPNLCKQNPEIASFSVYVSNYFSKESKGGSSFLPEARNLIIGGKL